MSVFRFKQFSVKNLRSAMKVNTDGVLLGACLQFGDHPVTVLDAGTGTGTIALMAAQRLNEKGILESSRIVGIDIAILIGIGIQATRTTAQIGRVLGTIAFSKCFF